MSDTDSKATHTLLWTTHHVRGLLVLLTLLTAILCVRLACNHSFIDDPEPDVPARMNDLADCMDPNTATWQEFAAIPGLGEKKSQAIVAFREKWIQTHSNQPAFVTPQDLHRVKGIGPATISTMSKYLIFPKAAKPSP